MLHLEREARDSSTYEYSYITAVRIIIAALPHIPISLLNFGGVACRIPFTSSANTPKTWWEGNFLFFSGRKVFFQKPIFAHTLLINILTRFWHFRTESYLVYDVNCRPPGFVRGRVACPHSPKVLSLPLPLPLPCWLASGGRTVVWPPPHSRGIGSSSCGLHADLSCRAEPAHPSALRLSLIDLDPHCSQDATRSYVVSGM